jgi:hypothetical protein
VTSDGSGTRAQLPPKLIGLSKTYRPLTPRSSVRETQRRRRDHESSLVSEAEYQQILKTGKFQAGPNSLGGKWFAESAKDAAKWGELLNGGKGNFRIIETTLPESTAEGLMRLERLDGIGPARYGELDTLIDAVIREVK